MQFAPDNGWPAFDHQVVGGEFIGSHLKPFFGVHIQGEAAIDGKGETDAVMVPELRYQLGALRVVP